MSSRPTLRFAGLGLLSLLVVLFGYQLLSGSTRFVVAAGASMEPLVEAGDLVIVRSQDRYEIGDVVAYRSATLGTVLHRIVDERIEDGERRFVMQGDSNDFLDSEEPSESAVLGRAGPIIPNGGSILPVLPIVAAALFALYWFFSSEDEPVPTGAGPGQLIDLRQVSGWALAAVATVVAIVAITKPTSEPFQRPISHETSIDVDWTADVAASVVYPDGTLDRDDPVFLSEIDTVEVAATVTMDERVTDPRGTLVLEATVSDDSGWNHRIDLVNEGVDLGVGEAVGTIDLVELGERLDEVAERTGHRPSQYDVLVDVRSQIAGRLDGEWVEQDVALEVPLVLDEVMLSATGDASWSSTALGTATVEETRAAALGVGGIEAPITTVRIVAPLALLLGLLLAVWPRRRMAEHELINQHFGSLVVSVERAELPANVATVTVESFGDLLRLAQIEASPILHVEGDSHEWATSAMGVWYRFVLVNAALSASGEESATVEIGPEPMALPSTAAERF